MKKINNYINFKKDEKNFFITNCINVKLKCKSK